MFRSRSPIVLIQNVVSALIGYVGLLFVIRYIGPTDWGFVSFGIGFVGILSIFGDLGYSTAHSIKVSEGEDIGLCNGTFLFIKLILGSLFIALVVGTLLVWVDVLHRGFESPIEYYVAFALIPYYFFSSFSSFSRTYFNAKLKSVRFALPPLIEALLRNSIFIILAIILHFHLSTILTEYAAIALASTYSFSYTVYFLVSFSLGRPWVIKRPTRKMLRSYTLLALPLMLVTTVSTFNGNIDKVVIQFFWGAIPTGAFYTGQTIAVIITSLSTSMSAFFLPLLVRMKNFSKGMHNENIFEFERKISLFILPIAVPIIVLSAYVLNLFSAAYFVFYPILSFLAIRAYISVINSPYSSSLASRSLLKTIAKIDLTLVISNIILIIILVPIHVPGRLGYLFGPSGAAFAAVVTGITSTLIYRYKVSKVESIGFNLSILRQLPAVAVQGAFLYVISRTINVRDIFILIPLTVASIVIYFLVSIGMREITFGTIISIIRSFSPSRIMKTFRGEQDSSYDDISEVIREE